MATTFDDVMAQLNLVKGDLSDESAKAATKASADAAVNVALQSQAGASADLNAANAKAHADVADLETLILQWRDDLEGTGPATNSSPPAAAPVAGTG